MSQNLAVTTTETTTKRRVLPWLAAGACGALVLGGGTFALWSDSETFDGGTIQSGNLDLTAGDQTAFYDVSADRDDIDVIDATTTGTLEGHIIDDSTWRIVPGDEVAGVFSATVTLEGDNLIAELAISSEESALVNEGMTYSYEIYRDGTPLVAKTALPAAGLDGAVLAHLAAPETGDGLADAETRTPVLAMDDDTETYSVVVYGEFDADEQDEVSVTDTIGAITLELTQVRTAGAGQFAA